MHIASAQAAPAGAGFRFVEASQPEHTDAGALLGHLYYSGFINKTLKHGVESFGYPHNGGLHSLSLRLAPADLQAWLTLVEEQYAGHLGLADFVSNVRRQLH